MTHASAKTSGHLKICLSRKTTSGNVMLQIQRIFLLYQLFQLLFSYEWTILKVTIQPKMFVASNNNKMSHFEVGIEVRCVKSVFGKVFE